MAVLSVLPYKVIITFESVDKILKYDHSNEVVLNFESVCDILTYVWPLKGKLLSLCWGRLFLAV